MAMQQRGQCQSVSLPATPSQGGFICYSLGKGGALNCIPVRVVSLDLWYELMLHAEPGMTQYFIFTHNQYSRAWSFFCTIESKSSKSWQPCGKFEAKLLYPSDGSTIVLGHVLSTHYISM